MAAYYEKWYPLTRYSFEGIRPAMHVAGRQLGWTLEAESVEELRFLVKGSWKSAGEWFIVRQERGGVLFRSECIKAQAIAFGKNRVNVVDFIRTFQAVLLGQMQRSNEDGETSESVRIFHLNQAFIPRQGFWATPLLLYANILIWLLMVVCGVSAMDPDSITLFNWGANFGPATVSGDAWRLGTSLFLHSGIIHLLLNMLSLAALGQLLESVTGSVLFLLFYLTTGLLASLASTLFQAPIVSVGASGAIMGVAGVLIGLLVLKRKAIFPAYPDLLRNIAISLMPTFVYGLTMPQVDNAAHLGGLIGGFVLGLGTATLLQSRGRQKSIAAIMPVVTGIACIVFTLTAAKNLAPGGPADPLAASKEFDRLRQNLIENESKLNSMLERRNVLPDTMKLVNAYALRGIRLTDSIMSFPTFNVKDFKELFDLQRQRYLLIDEYSRLMQDATSHSQEEMERELSRLGKAFDENRRKMEEAEKKLSEK